ncbi:MAG: membrane protein insertion efficiency factor YidD [Emcibacteraceae bacterium]|uniref:membrane protein insertion efficiency factor YidD n=1 Tax=Pseudemcibacter sp. TaxID=2943293 RepID=UPI002324B965|nr:membrane protein insertion efficiency factor YidD [Kordiimonadaceae bacterium]MDA7569368.1 membrane protein insertion efficiency factor YidD [Emcibacteraceae bacterium]MDA9554099.1 membrane protein insertion efficiency factor YidD [Emcibacteraceae bacterium]MDC1090112.1 membrane protein insertion efficiency factor YidD [Emcibacteraceae bacterium]MDG1021900.1 membrane protein insertion efficiency factor YidD [Emcibacteraceae bacterium]
MTIFTSLFRFFDLIVSYILKALITVYKYVFSPLLGPKCRYLPTCSSYTMEAIEKHGPFMGSWLGIKRILRCHPWGGSGYDPVPDKRNKGSENCNCNAATNGEKLR